MNADLQQLYPTLPEEGVTRRACFNISITDDKFYENTESFTLLLELDILTPQPKVRMGPSTTEIFIIDNEASITIMDNDGSM